MQPSKLDLQGATSLLNGRMIVDISWNWARPQIA